MRKEIKFKEEIHNAQIHCGEGFSSLHLISAGMNKVENHENILSEMGLKKLAIIDKVTKKELTTSWVGDKIMEMEKIGKEALQLVFNSKKSND